MIALLAGVIATLSLWSAIDGFMTGATTIGSRGGRAVRIHLSGWRAYVSSSATLLFGLSCLSMAVACVAGSFAPLRHAHRVGPAVHRLFHLSWRLLVTAGALALITTFAYFLG